MTSNCRLLLVVFLIIQSSIARHRMKNDDDDDEDDDDDDDDDDDNDKDSFPHSVDYDEYETRNYRGHALLRITPQNERQIRMLASIVDANDRRGVDVWQGPSVVKKDVDILVPPETKDYLSALILENGFQLNVITDDLQSLVDEERRSRSVDIDNSDSAPNEFNLSTYHNYDEIMAYLDYLNATCLNFTCSTEIIGQSYEGRDLKLIKIGDMANTDKPGFWIDAGIHAREWISPASALFLINKLLDPTSDVGRYLVDRYRWYILPLSNPDGYDYTWTTDRLWRKTRSKHPNPKVKCRGVDPNRNWDFHWGGRGTSSKPCTENYSGWKPFSEKETRAMADYILSISDSLAIYISLHSYGQFLLTPWGYTTKLPADYNDLVALGKLAADAIYKRHGKKYTVGSASRVLYLASGGSDDWAKGVAGIKYSFTIELRDSGKNGFILPKSMIKDTGEELVSGIEAMAGGFIVSRRQIVNHHLDKN